MMSKFCVITLIVGTFNHMAVLDSTYILCFVKKKFVSKTYHFYGRVNAVNCKGMLTYCDKYLPAQITAVQYSQRIRGFCV